MTSHAQRGLGIQSIMAESAALCYSLSSAGNAVRLLR